MYLVLYLLVSSIVINIINQGAHFAITCNTRQRFKVGLTDILRKNCPRPLGIPPFGVRLRSRAINPALSRGLGLKAKEYEYDGI